MATKGVEVSPAVLVGAVVVLLGMGTWMVFGSDLLKQNGDVVAVATPTPTVSASPTATATPEATATPIPAVASGWVRYNLASTGVSFDYPKTFVTVSSTDEDVTQDKNFPGTGHSVVAYFKVSTANENDHSLSLLSESLDFTSDKGRGSSVLDDDGFEKVGSAYKTFKYTWADAKKSELAAIPDTDTAEAITTTGGFEALIITGGGVEEDYAPPLLKKQFAAIVMLPAKTGYHAVSLKTGTDKMTKADFTALVKSFHLTK
jgi:hypothetical protein